MPCFAVVITETTKFRGEDFHSYTCGNRAIEKEVYTYKVWINNQIQLFFVEVLLTWNDCLESRIWQNLAGRSMQSCQRRGLSLPLNVLSPWKRQPLMAWCQTEPSRPTCGSQLEGASAGTGSWWCLEPASKSKEENLVKCTRFLVKLHFLTVVKRRNH